MGFFTILIYIILSCAVGSILLATSLNLVEVGVLTGYLERIVFADFYFPSIPWVAALTGLIIILMCLRCIQTSLRRSRKDKSITFESPEGNVSITLLALEDMLKKMLEERTEVSHIKPKVILRKKGIEVVIRGVLTSEANLVEFTREIQEKIKEKMNVLLGEDKPVKVNLEIRKVVMGGRRENFDDSEPEIPFRNYE